MKLKNDNEKHLIDTMHEYLSVFRKLSKYSSEELGNEIGVSRSTMVNFERNADTIRMSKAQYIALRTVLEARAEELANQDDDSLKKAIELVFYNQNYEKNKKEIKETLTTVGAVCGLAGSISVGTLLAPVVGGVALATGLCLGIASTILKGLNEKDDN